LWEKKGKILKPSSNLLWARGNYFPPPNAYKKYGKLLKRLEWSWLLYVVSISNSITMIEVPISDNLPMMVIGWPIVDNSWIYYSLKTILCLYLLAHSSLFRLCFAKVNCSRWVYETWMGPNEKSTFILNKMYIIGKNICFYFILPHPYVCTHWVQFVNEFLISYRLKCLNYHK